jgi:hypothetical protein
MIDPEIAKKAAPIDVPTRQELVLPGKSAAMEITKLGSNARMICLPRFQRQL